LKVCSIADGIAIFIAASCMTSPFIEKKYIEE
jgi:hypothetical protein